MVTVCISVFLTREWECSILLACLRCGAATEITSFETSIWRPLTLLATCRFSMKNWDGLRHCLVSEELALRWARILRQTTHRCGRPLSQLVQYAMSWPRSLPMRLLSTGGI